MMDDDICAECAHERSKHVVLGGRDEMCADLVGCAFQCDDGEVLEWDEPCQCGGFKATDDPRQEWRLLALEIRDILAQDWIKIDKQSTYPRKILDDWIAKADKLEDGDGAG